MLLAALSLVNALWLVGGIGVTVLLVVALVYWSVQETRRESPPQAPPTSGEMKPPEPPAPRPPERPD